jgi:serine/threonine-protein kinase
VLHEMLAGAQPVTTRTILPIEMVNPAVPAPLAAIVGRALERDREKRFRTAGELGLALEKHLYGGGYGPTNLSLAAHLRTMFPEIYELPDAAPDAAREPTEARP